MVGFDKYDIRARLYPGLLAALPVAFVVVTLGLKKYQAVSVASGLVVAAGGMYALAVTVRHLGRRVEQALWESWGGRPTTQLLRTRDTSDNPVQRDIWRKAVEVCTAVTLLDAAEEASDPVRADQTIEAAVNQLTRLGRDPRYPLVRSEVIEYGYYRNVYGIRWPARILSWLCVAALVGALIGGYSTVSRGALVVGVIVDAAIAMFWILAPSEKRTKLAAERYARQLLRDVVEESRRTSGGSG
jgi:hypothetical protein